MCQRRSGLPPAGSTSSWCVPWAPQCLAAGHRAPRAAGLRRRGPLPLTGSGCTDGAFSARCRRHARLRSQRDPALPSRRSLPPSLRASLLPGLWPCPASLLTFLRAWFPHYITSCCPSPGTGLLFDNARCLGQKKQT